MEKRFQVFVSSTYADLKEERSRVIQTLMEMDCIPSGMELFSASDEEQWEFIKRVIDDCDYYLLIIGGRYGTTDIDGLSYTEKEYEYAVEKGLKIVALLHENPDDLPDSKNESNPEFKEKLSEFRAKVATGRLVKFWNRAEDLPGLVSLSLIKTIKTFPAIGWIRANQVSNEDLLTEINDLRKINIELETRLKKYETDSIPSIDNLAGLDENITLRFEKYDYDLKRHLQWDIKTTWKDIFKKISPFILKLPNEELVNKKFNEELADRKYASINDQDFQTIKLQLISLKLVEVKYSKTTQGGMGWFWNLTPKGNKLMIELRTIKNATN